MKKKLSFVAVIFTMLAVMCVSVCAINNTIMTAKPIQLNTTETITFETKYSDDAYDQFRWFTFTPSVSDCYTFIIKNPYYGDSDNDTFVCIYNSLKSAQNEVALIYEDMQTNKKIIQTTINLKANQKYYIQIQACSCLGINNPHTMTLNISEKHNLKTDIIKATTSKDGVKNVSCLVCAKTNSVSIPKISSIVLSKSKFTYNGKVITPTVTVKDRKGKVLKLNTDYTVKYSSGRKNPGRYAVKVMFKGDYTGSETLYFDILPCITSKISASQSTNAIKLSWSAVPNATGYRVFLYNAKTKKYTTLANTTKNTYTVSKLNPGTNYTFAVRAYSTVSGKVFWSAGYKTLTTATKPNTLSLKVVAGAGKAVLTWNKQAGVDGYVVYMSTSKDGKYTRIATVKGNSSVNYTKTGLTKGKTYYFKVAAYKTVGNTNIYSSFSTVRYVKIK